MNGINLEGLDAARKAIAANRKEGIASYGLAMTWKEGVQMEARATGIQIGSEKIARDFSWPVSEPAQLLGGNTGPTPQEYLMSGVGACIMVGFVVNASVKGVKLRALKINMTGSLDLAGFMNVGEDAQIKMRGIDYEIEVDCDADEATLDEIAKAAFEFSPNAMTVQNGIPVQGRVKQSA
tara:strand:- start:3118 stop:3657 length:540 start_codon:yes stop_codon:yes gene_type:complete